MATKNNKEWHEAHIRLLDSLPFGSPFSRGEPGLAVVQVGATRRSAHQRPVSFTTCLSQSKIRPNGDKTDAVLLPQTDSDIPHPLGPLFLVSDNKCLPLYLLHLSSRPCGASSPLLQKTEQFLHLVSFLCLILPANYYHSAALIMKNWVRQCLFQRLFYDSSKASVHEHCTQGPHDPDPT